MDLKQRVNDLITIGSRLAELLAKENEALHRKQPREVAQFVEEKSNLSRAYESRIQGLVERAEDLEEVDIALRDRLRRTGEKIAPLAEENARLLTIAMETHHRVVQVIADAVKSSQPGPNVYSASGAVGAGAKGAAPQTAPLSVDQTL